ncbi:MAG: phosphotransferase, partial [Chloroflexota bacterium]
MTEKLGRADLHIHTIASDGTASVVDILDHVEASTDLDVIAITDHERIDAALAGRAIARDRGLRFEV